MAAHDAGHTHAALAVCDEEDVGLGVDGLAVEQRDRLHGGRPRGAGVVRPKRTSEAHVDVPANFRKVVGMHRLSQLEQHVVRNVNDRTN